MRKKRLFFGCIRSKQPIVGAIVLCSMLFVFALSSTLFVTTEAGDGEIPAFTSDFETQAYYDDWNYYRTISLESDYVPESLAGFPILVTLDSTISAKCDGGDSVRFTAEDNETEYPFEIEGNWSDTGTNFIWVNVSQVVAGSDTVFIFHYNNSDATSNHTIGTTVWNGYEWVCHMNDTNTSYVYDSAKGTNYFVGKKDGANTPLQSNGVAGYSQNFSGGEYKIIIASAGHIMPETNDYTIEGWTKNISNTSIYRIWCWYVDTDNRADFACGRGTDGTNKMTFHAEDQTVVYVYGANRSVDIDYNNSIWHYSAAVSVRDTSVSFNYDGKVYAPDGETLGQYDLDDIAEQWIGKSQFSAANIQYSKTQIDELRMSFHARNSSWLNVSYHSTNQTIGFLTMGAEQSQGGGGISSYSLKGLTSGRITWAGTAGNIVWCNTSGDGHEWLEINMSINSSENVTDILVYLTDLNDTNAWINASNISLYCTDVTNGTYYSFGTYTDGGSNISLNKTTWAANAGALDNPFDSSGLTNCNYSIYCVFRLEIPSDLSSDEFRTPATTSYKIYLGRYV